MAGIIILIVMGFVCAGIASSKGRNPAGWFFIGFIAPLIGLILILCLPDLNQEQEEKARTERETRRLREQLRQERLKNQAFQEHVHYRLDKHDQSLGMNTRSTPALEAAGTGTGSEATPQLNENTAPPQDDDDNAVWYYLHRENQKGPVTKGTLRRMIADGDLPEDAFVWRTGMTNWQHAVNVSELQI